MKTIICNIPHKKQRYPTVGDWTVSKGVLTIKVSRMSDWRYELLVGLHELVEASLCRQRNISQETVDAFDTNFERKRKAGNVDEPGDDPKAPYRVEHFAATNLERLMAIELGVDWYAYSQEVNNL
jgi:hypothetical protein